MNKLMIFVATIILLTVAISGCIEEKKPPPSMNPSKYTAQILEVVDITDKYPNLIPYIRGWYNPTTLQHVSRYVDSQLGMANRQVSLYLIANPTRSKLSLVPMTGDRDYYVNIYTDRERNLPINSEIAKVDSNHIYRVTVQYDTPNKNDLQFISKLALVSTEGSDTNMGIIFSAEQGKDGFK